MYGMYVEHELSDSTRDGTWDEFLRTYYADLGGADMPTQNGPAPRMPQKVGLSGPQVVYLPLVQR
jgi:hypothetical protein